MSSSYERSAGLAVVLLMIACGGAPPPASPKESAPAQVAPEKDDSQDARARSGEITDPKDALVPVSEDRSLEYPVYAASGMPTLTAPWAASDYAAAAKSLGDLAQKNRLFLPREKSARSGAVFERMLSHENFASLSAESAPEYLHTLPLLLGPYSPQKDGVAFPREQARLVALLLWVYPRALASLATASGDPKSEKVLEEQRVVAVDLVRGAAQMLQESGRYRAADRRIIAEALATEGLALQAHLTPEQATEITPLLQAR